MYFDTCTSKMRLLPFFMIILCSKHIIGRVLNDHLMAVYKLSLSHLLKSYARVTFSPLYKVWGPTKVGSAPA